MNAVQTFRQFAIRFESFLRKISGTLRTGILLLSGRAQVPMDLVVDLLGGPTRFWPPMKRDDRWALQVAKATLVRFGDLPEIDPVVVSSATTEEELGAMRILEKLAVWVRQRLSLAYDNAYWKSLLGFEDPTLADQVLTGVFLGKERVAHPLLSLSRDVWFEFVP
jgi:hypothetical protein